MRLVVIVLFALVLPAAASRAGTPRGLLVAQLAGPPAAAAPAGPATRAAGRDAATLARLAPRLAALGLVVRRALLDVLPPPSPSACAAAPVPGLALERIVLLEAADSAAADAARSQLADAGLVDWVEPLAMRALADAAIGAARAADGAGAHGAAGLDSLPGESLFRDSHQWGLWNVGAAGGAIYGGIARADVHAIEGWRLGVGADDVRLAIADTGVDAAQPELGGLLRDGSPRIVDTLNVTADGSPAITDAYGHGTLVAGVAAARTNDGPHFGGQGVAGVCGGDGVTTSGCRIVAIKISPGHEGEASSFDIAAAIVHAADVGARAMNLSYAGTSPTRIERLALAYAIVRGCVVVAAAGNSGARANPRQPMYPAAFALDGLCIQVGASEWNDARAPFSSYGPGLDLVAPGMNVWTTYMTYPSYYGAFYDGYVPAAGTSFAAPFVTGAVGLLAAARPELTDNDFQHVLRETAADIGAPGIDEQTGWGRLDLGAALAAVGPEIGIWHDEVAAQRFEPDTGAAMLQIGERGPGTLDRYSGSVFARRFAAMATVTLPDSFVDSVRVWVRVGGTMAVRGDYRLPYFASTAQVVARGGRTFTLRGWLYRAEEDSCAGCTDNWIPLPPEYARFGFTVMGRVQRGAVGVPGPAPGPPPALAAGPNPFRDALHVRVPGPGRITVLDAGGRAMRSWSAPGGDDRWDGRDAAGTPAPPGLYFIRWRDARTMRSVRVVKLQP